MILAAALTLPLFAAAPASAHGIQGHIHVTGWAIENLPPGDVRDFFEDPVVMNAALFGAAFTDSGYFPQSGELAGRSRAYSEHTHWEPFVQDYIEWMVENDPPPWDTQESQIRVAFLMGCASHGLQDEIFDSLFLYQVQEQDGGGQDEADPGTDGFFASDGYIRFSPTPVVPYTPLLDLYETLNAGIDRDTIDDAVNIMTTLYVNDSAGAVAAAFGEQYREEIPWTAAHYLDPSIPGSLRAEINPTVAYIQAIWERLHGRLDQAVIHVYPEEPRRLRSHLSTTVDGWVTLTFAAGVDRSSLDLSWQNEDGEDVPFTLAGTRWGNGAPRLVRLQPDVDLAPGERYDVTLAAGAQLLSDTESPPFQTNFQTSCLNNIDPICPDLGEIPVPSIDGPQDPVEPRADAGADTRDADVSAAEEPEAESPTAGSGEGGCASVPPAPLASWLLLAGAGLLRRSRRTGRRYIVS
ncbi:MAG: hypothetical protein ACI81R_003099 [Bradymonadia bacterium]|jgi:hypothetical protein